MIAGAVQRAHDVMGVIAVTRLNGHVQPGALGRNVEKPPTVIPFQVIGAELPEQRGNRPEHTGPAPDGQLRPAHPPVYLTSHHPAPTPQPTPTLPPKLSTSY